MASAELTNDQHLADAAAEFWGRPYEFVMFAWPWQEPGSWLENEPGTDGWQRKVLIDLGEEIRERNFDGHAPVEPIQMAVGSGHGPGKSALVAWLIWFISVTRPFCRGVVTASTGPQLESKTIPELAKWSSLCLYRHWFELRATIPGRFAHVQYPETWRVDFQTSKKENADAFQGLHARTSTPFVIMDESSGVPDKIDEVARGGMTDGEPMYFKFGNRTANTGHFNDCFTAQSHNWIHYVVNSMQARHTNKTLLQRWVDEWGWDSDFVRVRVRGLAPKAAVEQLISMDTVDAAMNREPVAGINEPLIMGIDVARYGDDDSVFAYRKGRDMKTHPMEVHRDLDPSNSFGLMTLADRAAESINDLRPDQINIDGGGVGGGLVDRLRQLGFDVNEINFGGKSPDREYYDMRSCMWGRYKRWLEASGAIEADDELKRDLVSQQYFIDRRTRRTRLVSKEDLHSMGEDSPDKGDANVLTHAMTTADVIAAGGGAAGGATGAIERKKSSWHPTDRI